MSNKKNNKIFENFKNAQTVPKLREVLDAQKDKKLISSDMMYEKALSVCGLGTEKKNFSDICVNVSKLCTLLEKHPGHGYETVAEKLVQDKQAYLAELIDGVESLSDALILFNTISDYETCISPEDSGALIKLDKKIGAFCLDKNDIRGILTSLFGFLNKEWKESSRVEISKFYSRIFEKFCVVFFIGIKNASDIDTAIKYLECVYFNLPPDFTLINGMAKIITTEELINKFAYLCAKDEKTVTAVQDHTVKVSNLVLSIDKENSKTAYFCEQLKKRALESFSGAAPDDSAYHGEAEAGGSAEVVSGVSDDGNGVEKEKSTELSYKDVLAYPSDESALNAFYSLCKKKRSVDDEQTELYYIANAVRILIDEDLDKLPDPEAETADAVMWGRSFYNNVYDSYFNEKNQFYVLSSFSEAIPTIAKQISDFIRKFYENRKKSIVPKNFAAICIAYPNAFSRPYFIDAEKAICFVGKKNSLLLCDFIDFCLSNDFTQAEIAAHIVNNNSHKDGWEDAYELYGMPDDAEGDGYPSVNRGVWIAVIAVILIAAAAACYFLFFRDNGENGNIAPVITDPNAALVSSSTSTETATDTAATTSDAISSMLTTGTETSATTETSSATQTTEATTAVTAASTKPATPRTTAAPPKTTKAPAKTTAATRRTTTAAAPTATAHPVTSATKEPTTSAARTTQTTEKTATSEATSVHTTTATTAVTEPATAATTEPVSSTAYTDPVTTATVVSVASETSGTATNATEPNSSHA